ncbi:histidine kinase [Neobacillus cucumis]|uniref:Histidine kinase n=1 Tax=Neobacillus cucumis TaxID=1740721 RepID=A0A2N5HTW3_9BACI|nr:histidine kinase [Neobacillus cucumis]PLS08958.1 histidine kinase [Neobacillus cucumis]
MIQIYLKERASWILFFIFSQLLVLAMGYLDTSIPLLSTVYIAFISCLSFVIFMVMRYEKETRFYKHLQTLEPSFDLTAIPEANSPFEAIVSNRMSEQIQEFKHQLDELQISLEQEKDDMLNWIHEVKTPLTTLQLMIERTDPTLRSQLMYEWLRIHLLLDQQLHLKRIPFIQNDLYIEKTDVRKLLFQEIKSLRQWCMQKRVNYSYDPLVLGINKKLFDSMSEEDQELVKKLGKEAAEYQVEMAREKEEKQISELKDAGMQFYAPTDEELAKFTEAVQPVYKKYENIWGKDLLDKFQDQ